MAGSRVSSAANHNIYIRGYVTEALSTLYMISRSRGVLGQDLHWEGIWLLGRYVVCSCVSGYDVVSSILGVPSMQGSVFLAIAFVRSLMDWLGFIFCICNIIINDNNYTFTV
jgi:hypothetical protein